jgi:hypothetical protein
MFEKSASIKTNNNLGISTRCCRRCSVWLMSGSLSRWLAGGMQSEKAKGENGVPQRATTHCQEFSSALSTAKFLNPESTHS